MKSTISFYITLMQILKYQSGNHHVLKDFATNVNRFEE